MAPLALLFTWPACALAGGDLTFELDDPAEAYSPVQIEAFRVAGGQLVGQTAWDPYFYLRLPKEGVDVSDKPYLTVRLYSSAAADVLDVYYRSSDGRWGLGRTLPIRRGWATYRADLREAQWTESGMMEDARQWGGPSKRIVTFRLDPGNEAGRWIAVDRVILSAEPTGPAGVEAEPRGRAVEAAVSCPAEVTAGDPIPVTFTCRAEPPEGLTAGTVLLRLMSAGSTVQAQQQAVAFTAAPLQVTYEFPTSRWAYGGELSVRAEVLELDSEATPTAPCRLHNPRVGTTAPAQTKVADYRGDPAVYVNGEPRPLITYLHYGGEHGALHRQAAAAGLKVYTDWFGASIAGNLGQVAPGVYDYTSFDQYFVTVLEAVPDAYFLPHIGLTAPAWWQREHPEECCLFSDGTRGPSSLFSERWRTEAAADLQKLIRHLREAPYADRILGYLFYSGYTAEWQMWGTWQEVCDDYSQPAVEGFRRWLRAKYGTDEALQRAWNDPAVTLATAEVPAAERRRETSPFVRDPATDRAVIDVNRYFSEGTAEAIMVFARATKEACGGTQIAGTYYGYMAAHGARQQFCGHNALGLVLDCPDVDLLMSPNMYAHRELGGTSTFMSATESVRLHRKLWFDESDLRTYLSNEGAGYGRTETPEQSVAVTWREFANVLTRRAAVGWFDMDGGWFADAPMWDCYRRQLPVAAEAFARREPFAGDVALFVDERSFDGYRYSDLTRRMITDTVANMPHVGVTWDFYLLSDVAAPSLPHYRLYVVLNALSLDEATRDALWAQAARDDATVLFLYAPGYAGEHNLHAARITRMTGMAVAIEAGPASPDYRLEAAHPLARGLDPTQPLCPGPDLAPRPVIADPAAEVIARFADSGGVALARKTHQGVTVLYCTSVNVPVPLLRNIAREAGAHVYIDGDDSLYTDGQYLAVHTASDGTKTIQLPAARRVVDVIAGETIAENTTVIARDMRRGETLFVSLLAPQY